ncbi:hypothetical protein [Clostridium hydrogenum]|uniref:hypothetical protein n=1 Tax=Clostridium hydrogenum TaxID=2855764 RepID=UPI001F413F6E|nr:hypothetical protein [Clostridium hydrogenum]
MAESKEMFELMTKMYAEMQNGFKSVNSEIKALKSGQEELKNEIRKTNVVIENEIKPKIQVLFDGYKQHGEQLTRIEKEVSKHEEIILRRVK